jgi:hypothetical protein
MKVMLMSVIAALVLGAGAAYLLNVEQRSAYQAFRTEGARVDDPGHNLVGRSWSGQPGPGNPGEPRGVPGAS